MCHVAALPRHLVYHHFRVYDNVSRLFSIDFFSKMINFKEESRYEGFNKRTPKMTLVKRPERLMERMRYIWEFSLNTYPVIEK